MEDNASLSLKTSEEMNVDIELQQHQEEQEAMEDVKMKKDEIEHLLTDALDEFYLDDTKTLSSSVNTIYDEPCSSKQADLRDMCNSPREYLQPGIYNMKDQFTIYNNTKDERDLQLHNMLATQENYLGSDAVDKDSQLEVLYSMRVLEVQDLKEKIQLMEELSDKSLEISEKRSLLFETEKERLQISFDESQELLLEKMKKIEDYLIEIDGLNSLTEALQNENDQLYSEKIILKNSIMELETRLKVVNSTPPHSPRSSVVSNINQKNISDNTSGDHLSTQLDLCEKEKSNLLTELQKKNDEYEYSLLEKCTTIKELENNVEELIRENAAMTLKLKEQKAEHINLRNTAVNTCGSDQLEESNQHLRQELFTTSSLLSKSRDYGQQIQAKVLQMEQELECDSTEIEHLAKDETIQENGQLIETLQKEISQHIESISRLKAENEDLTQKNLQADALIDHLQRDPFNTEQTESIGYKKRCEMQKVHIMKLNIKYENLCSLCDKLSKHNIVLKNLCDVDADNLMDDDQTQSHSDTEVVEISTVAPSVPVQCFKDQMKRNVKMLKNEMVIENKLKALSIENRRSIKKMVNSWKSLLELVEVDKRCVQLELKTLANQMEISAEEINDLLTNNQELKNELKTLTDNYSVLKDSYIDVNSRVLGFVRNKTFLEIGKKLKKCSTRADLEVRNIERYYRMRMGFLPSSSDQEEVRASGSGVPPFRRPSASLARPAPTLKRPRPKDPAKPKPPFT